MNSKKENVSDLIKTRERVRDFGEVYTPLNLVGDMLSEIPHETWSDPKKTFFEPACGNGIFLIEIVKKKIDCGVSPIDALRGTYGVDIIHDNVVECRIRLMCYVLNICQNTPEGLSEILNSNIRHGNALEFDVEDIFSDNPSEELKHFRRGYGSWVSIEELQNFREKYDCPPLTNK